MTTDYDRSLDEIIRTTKTKQKFSGGISRNKTKTIQRPKQRRYFYEDSPININSTLTNRLNISNLHYGVTESDLECLFEELGTIRSLTLHYDRSGRSLGTADVIYEMRLDALRAVKALNGVPLDGRPMKIEFSSISSSGRLPQQKLYVPPMKNYSFTQRGNGGSGSKRRNTVGRPFQQRATQNDVLKHENNRYERIIKKQPTLEELDAELDAYVNNNSETDCIVID